MAEVKTARAVVPDNMLDAAAEARHALSRLGKLITEPVEVARRPPLPEEPYLPHSTLIVFEAEVEEEPRG